MTTKKIAIKGTETIDELRQLARILFEQAREERKERLPEGKKAKS